MLVVKWEALIDGQMDDGFMDGWIFDEWMECDTSMQKNAFQSTHINSIINK